MKNNEISYRKQCNYRCYETPYCADNTGKVDCTETIRKILDDILIRQVEALRATYDKLIELSYYKKEDVSLGNEANSLKPHVEPEGAYTAVTSPNSGWKAVQPRGSS